MMMTMMTTLAAFVSQAVIVIFLASDTHTHTDTQTRKPFVSQITLMSLDTGALVHEGLNSLCPCVFTSINVCAQTVCVCYSVCVCVSTDPAAL